MSEDHEPAKPATRGKGKKATTNGTTTNGRRKAEDAPTKGPAKKAKTAASVASADYDNSDDDDGSKMDEHGSKSKMTDEEKRKNFLERNR